MRERFKNIRQSTLEEVKPDLKLKKTVSQYIQRVLKGRVQALPGSFPIPILKTELPFNSYESTLSKQGTKTSVFKTKGKRSQIA